MKYDKEGRIIEATRSELYNNWLSLDLYELYSFDDYLRGMKSLDVVILEEDRVNVRKENYERLES